MSANYDQIHDEHRRESDAILHRAVEMLVTLYSERTHFIFELLQNAEDAKATRVLFRLSPGRLEFFHDGEVFTEKDVRSICDVANGPKADDLTKIGKFGVGFKSVYAYVATPEIHSGDEHFRIENYIDPKAIPSEVPEGSFTTFFRLPYRGDQPAASEAAAEIDAALRKLNPTVLLFLRHIELIQFEVDGAPIPPLKRNVTRLTEEWVRKVTLEPSDPQHGDGYWLVFSRPVTLQSDDGKNHGLRVELAFRVKLTDATGRGEIAPQQQSPLVVFFPTAIPTNLGFLIQGPYRTTPSRDNVRAGDPSNQKLVCTTAALVVRSLRWLKENDMLTVSVLESLPITRDQFPPDSMFRPVFEQVLDAIRNEAFLPASMDESGNKIFASGRAAKFAGSSDLRRLTTPEQLAQLWGSSVPFYWISEEISAARTLKLWRYLREDVKIEVINADVLTRKLTQTFLEQLPDSQLGKLYAFFGRQNSWLTAFRYLEPNPQRIPFLDKPIIRLDSGAHVTPTKPDGSPAAYLSPDSPTAFPCVKREVVATKEALAFLTALGFHPPDLTDEVLENVLPRYSGAPDFESSAYLLDISQIAQALDTDSVKQRQRLVEALRICPFLKARNAGTEKYAGKTPAEVYLPTSELEEYFAGNPSAWFLDSALTSFRETLQILGVANKVRITAQEPDEQGHVVIDWRHSNHRRGLDGFDAKFKVDGLAHALKRPTLERAVFVWNRLLAPNARHIRGTIESSSRQNYDRSTKAESFSPAGKIATGAAWLPDPADVFRKPSEISLSELPVSFERNEKLAEQLQMKPEPASVTALAKLVGVPLETLEYLRQNNVTTDELAEFIKQRRIRDSREPSAPEPVEAPNHNGRLTSDQPASPPARSTGGQNSPVSDARPHPQAGLDAQEWLRLCITETMDLTRWEVSKSELSTPGDQGRTDILITHRPTRQQFHLEAKRIEGMKVFWSEKQIALARSHPARYLIALLKPTDDQEPYSVHWVWNPLGDLEACERNVQWTWKENSEGGFGSDWQPTNVSPAKDADSFRAVIRISDAFLPSLPRDIESLRLKIEQDFA